MVSFKDCSLKEFARRLLPVCSSYSTVIQFIEGNRSYIIMEIFCKLSIFAVVICLSYHFVALFLFIIEVFSFSSLTTVQTDKDKLFEQIVLAIFC